MPRIVIKFGKTKVQQMILELGREYTMGRSQDCDVVLPNVSVSRVHARLLVDDQGVRVVDMGSQNGLYFDGARIEERYLNSSDEIMIGRYSFVFLGDEPDGRFFEGRAVTYLPHYGAAPASKADQTGTFAIDVAELKRIQRVQHMIGKARLVLEGGGTRTWIPGERSLTLGPGGMVSLPGMGSFGGVVAELTWSGSQHIIEAKARLTATKVNGQKVVGSRGLKNGDRIRIGKVGLVYEVPTKA